VSQVAAHRFSDLAPFVLGRDIGSLRYRCSKHNSLPIHFHPLICPHTDVDFVKARNIDYVVHGERPDTPTIECPVS
jgi:hypothetical protein